LSKLRAVMLCLACAGLLAVPAAADAQKQKPGGNSPQCRSASFRVVAATEALGQAKGAVTSARKTVAKRKRALKKAKSKGSGVAKAKRRLKKAKTKLKNEKAALNGYKQRLAEAEQRKAQACS
jgi:hypothetical protein